MTELRTKLLLLVSLPAAALAAIGCNEDGQDIGAGKCNPTNTLPLFQWEFDGGQWRQVGVDGKPLSAADSLNLQQASQGQQRCITPAGKALTLKDAGKD